MKVAIKDANIIIDLIQIDLLDVVFLLKYEFITSDFVLYEIKDGNQSSQLNKYLQNDLKIIIIPPEEIANLYTLQQKSRQLSIADCSVLYLAEKLAGIILSGDKPLRNVAKNKKIEYHGILWIFDELINNKIITPPAAIKKLNQLMQINKRLPADECKKRIDIWKKIKLF